MRTHPVLAIARIIDLLGHHMPHTLREYVLLFCMACEIAAICICLRIIIEYYGVCKESRRYDRERQSKTNKPLGKPLGIITQGDKQLGYIIQVRREHRGAISVLLHAIKNYMRFLAHNRPVLTVLFGLTHARSPFGRKGRLHGESVDLPPRPVNRNRNTLRSQ